MRVILFAIFLVLFNGTIFGQGLLAGADFHYNKADSLYQIGNYAEAISHLKKGLLTTKNSADLNLLRAKCHLKLGETNIAEKYLRRASRIGSYASDKLLDSLRAGSRRTEASEPFKNELEEYLEKTNPPEK